MTTTDVVATRGLGLKVGDLVEVRSAEEILATLDVDGSSTPCRSCPRCSSSSAAGSRSTRSRTSCATRCPVSGMRRMRNAVHLTDVRCDGGAHGGCQPRAPHIGRSMAETGAQRARFSCRDHYVSDSPTGTTRISTATNFHEKSRTKNADLDGEGRATPAKRPSSCEPRRSRSPFLLMSGNTLRGHPLGNVGPPAVVTRPARPAVQPPPGSGHVAAATELAGPPRWPPVGLHQGHAPPEVRPPVIPRPAAGRARAHQVQAGHHGDPQQRPSQPWPGLRGGDGEVLRTWARPRRVDPAHPSRADGWLLEMKNPCIVLKNNDLRRCIQRQLSPRDLRLLVPRDLASRAG